MRKQLRRLRLKDGDIVLVRDWQTLEALLEAAKGMKNLPNCPIVVATESIRRLSKDYLQRLILSAKP